MVKYHLLPCAYKQLFGISCPMCGFQRAMILLFNGQILDSVYQFPIWPILVLWIICLLVMTIIGKAQLLLHNSWCWAIVIVCFIFNAFWQNLMY